MRSHKQTEAFNNACLQAPKDVKEAQGRFSFAENGRGFKIVTLQGERCADLEIQQSSVYRYEGRPGSSALWIKIKSLLPDDELADSVHLDYFMIGRLHNLLNHWLDTGELKLLE